MLKRELGGYRLSVHATAGAKHDSVGGCHDHALHVSVSVAPEKGKANQAIKKALAVALMVKTSQWVLISGETNRRKQFFISDPATHLPARVAELGRFG